MNVRGIVQWAVVILLAWYLITQPAAAGAFVHNAFGLLKQAGGSVATFLQGT